MQIKEFETRVEHRGEQLREAVHLYGNFSPEANDAIDALTEARRDLAAAIREARTKPSNNKRR